MSKAEPARSQARGAQAAAAHRKRVVYRAQIALDAADLGGGLHVEHLGLLLLNMPITVSDHTCDFKLYFRATRQGCDFHFVWDRINVRMPCVRTCSRAGIGRWFPRAGAQAQLGRKHAATVGRQAAGRKRGARSEWDGGITHLPNSGPGHRTARVVTGRHKEGQGAASRSDPQPP